MESDGGEGIAIILAFHFRAHLILTVKFTIVAEPGNPGSGGQGPELGHAGLAGPAQRQHARTSAEVMPRWSAPREAPENALGVNIGGHSARTQG